jgi:hypothetical protein
LLNLGNVANGSDRAFEKVWKRSEPLVAMNVGYRVAKWVDEGRLGVDAVEKVD